MKVIVTVYDHIDLLGHFVRHYLRLGFEAILLGVYSGARPALWKSVSALAVQYPLYVEECSFAHHGGHRAEADLQARLRLRERFCDAEEWCCFADLDELYEFPLPLDELVSELDRQEYNCVAGCFVDRVARDGSLPLIDADRSIFIQFPYGVDLTKNVLKGSCSKVMLFREPIRPIAGHHEAIPAELVRCYPYAGCVHHFKWNANALDRIHGRYERLREDGFTWADESKRFLDYWQKWQRIDLSDPILNARWLGEFDYGAYG